MSRRQRLLVAGGIIALPLAVWVGYQVWPTATPAGDDPSAMSDRDRIRACEACLPSGLGLDEQFSLSGETGPHVGSIRRMNPTTVRAQLLEHGAYCRDGKLYERGGRRLYFVREYDQIGFAGTFREAYQGQLAEWRAKRDRELAEQLRWEPGVVIHMWPMTLPH